MEASRPALRAWGEVFGTTDNRFETVRMLGLLNDEVGLALSQMKTGAPSLSDDVYLPAFADISQTLNLEQLGVAWGNFRPLISEETLRQLKMCYELTPNQEEPVNPDELAQLSSDLEDFAANVLGSSLPNEVKTFVLKQISLIRAAIREYGVVGIRAFRTAIGMSLVELDANRDLIEQHQDEPEVRTLGSLLGRVFSLAERFNTLASAVEAGTKILELGGDISDKLP